jgi:very-short-patch-repair endonuclease
LQNPRENSSKLGARAKAMRKQPSDAEHKLWQALRDRQLDGLKFRRQRPIGNYIADFACEECRLIVEVDGDQHDSVVAYDEKRTLALNDIGWRVIRFSAREVVQELIVVLETILLSAKPSP